MPEQLTDFGLYPPTGWAHTPETIAANNRLLLTETTDEADLQLKLEQLVVLHSIRRILIAVLVVVPLVVVVASLLVVLVSLSK
jgi:uncharacterized membrane protein YdbT with pleckstrin-like domain